MLTVNSDKKCTEVLEQKGQNGEDILGRGQQRGRKNESLQEKAEKQKTRSKRRKNCLTFNRQTDTIGFVRDC